MIMACARKGIPQEDHSLSWRGDPAAAMLPQMLFGRVQSFRLATQLNLPLQILSRETLALVMENPVWKVIGKTSI